MKQAGRLILIALGLLGIALTTIAWTGHRAAVRMAEMGRAIIHVRPGNGWSVQHPPEPLAPTGAAAVGDSGTAQMRFADVAAKDGLNYRWSIPGPRPLDILQTIGNGCAFLDYDNSGHLSVLLVGPRLALYQGNGHGHFTDVTHATGLDRFRGHFLGCAVGDYDNDGYDDLYISGYRTGLLLHNEHGKSFKDVTERAGLAPQPWGTSCAFAETVPGSGHLDLYIGNYARFVPGRSPRLCDDRGHLSSCSPHQYGSERDTLYQNDGDGRFRDATKAWKAGGYGHALGVAFADYDGSGRQSAYVANDELPGNLFKNTAGRFTDTGRSSGTAFDGHVQIHGGMGVDWGDYDNDGKMDLTVTAFQTEPKCVYRNFGSGFFEELSDSLALTRSTEPFVAFGVKWSDFSNDGWLDLMIANGHVQDNIHDIDPSATYREPTQFFHNDHGRLFVDMSDSAGPDLQVPVVGRGLAVGDFDNDGRVDALVVDSEGKPRLLHNVSQHTGHWLSFTLVGTKSNRDGYGALVTVQTPGLTQTRLCHADGSYLSSSDKRVHVGLGSAAVAKRVAVHWPDGHTDTYRNIRADRFYTIHEGETKISATPSSLSL